MSRAWTTLFWAIAFGVAAAWPWAGEGTDDQALRLVEQLRPDYRTWMEAVFEPSERLEKTLFVVQAASAGAVLGWCLFGVRTARRRR